MGISDSQFTEKGLCNRDFDHYMSVHHTPPLADPVPLNYAGKGILKLYDDYDNTPGWWNHYTPGALSKRDFIGLEAVYESSGDEKKLGEMTQATAAQLWVKELHIVKITIRV